MYKKLLFIDWKLIKKKMELCRLELYKNWMFVDWKSIKKKKNYWKCIKNEFIDWKYIKNGCLIIFHWKCTKDGSSFSGNV